MSKLKTTPWILAHRELRIGEEQWQGGPKGEQVKTLWPVQPTMCSPSSVPTTSCPTFAERKKCCQLLGLGEWFKMLLHAPTQECLLL